MARYSPQTQTPELMAQKREIARRLLDGGLTVTQISRQLRCSPAFVRKIAREVPSGDHPG